MRAACLITTFENCEIVEEDDPQEDAGDEFACLEEHDCIDPRGHLIKSQCGSAHCVNCGRIM